MTILIVESKRCKLNFWKEFENNVDAIKYSIQCVGRWSYVVGELPVLPYKNNELDLALCSHFLFLYSEQLSFDFHVSSIKELCRVASEARIFPLLDLGARKSRHLEDVIQKLGESGYRCNIKKVSYEFQKGGNEMLQVKSSKN